MFALHRFVVLACLICASIGRRARKDRRVLQNENNTKALARAFLVTTFAPNGFSNQLMGGTRHRSNLVRSPEPSMGVPKFFRWLTRYIPTLNDLMRAGRPANEWIDNLYFDMNGIIHPCTHGDHKDPDGQYDLTEEEQFQAIFDYTERLLRIAKPRKVVYLAIDGVAPRAKMNQQRSRRFRAPLETEKVRRLMEKSGEKLPENQFDSNCITPGTEFLYKLGKAFETWILEKTRENPDGPTFIFSGADVVGEGEHKIMEFIRRGRESGDFDEETRHCMYGLDADLVMLSLATHEPHFTLLRERQRGQRGRKDLGLETRQDYEDFVYVDIGKLHLILATMLRPNMTEVRMESGALPIKFEQFDDNRLVDDFVFMCMLAGNDFLPGLPSVDISKGSLPAMMFENGRHNGNSRCYRSLLPRHGYLTDKHELNFEALQELLARVATDESYYFWRNEGLHRRQYKQAFYLEKFGFGDADIEAKKSVIRSYIQGLSWCLQYYHHGCASWDWYYPEFCAPLPSDMMKGLSEYDIRLELGRPFPPISQLLSVLPPSSAACLPKSYQSLMLSPNSPIHDAYPSGFQFDENNKKAEYEYIALLPFIDERRLLEVTEKLERDLTDAERARNTFGDDIYFPPSGSDYRPGQLVGAKSFSTKEFPIESSNYGDMTVKQLKDELRMRGRKVSGNKKELLERLTDCAS